MATKKNNNENMNASNETKVMCPVCGTEFAIGEHEHKVKNAIAVGKDSGLGEVYLPISKRGKALQAAGIDTTKYFAIQLPTGGEQLMKMGENGVPVAVTNDDPVLAAINAQGDVPNRNLFRRWVMSQVFHWLQHDEMYGSGSWLKYHGYDYQWKMLVEELRVQAKLYGRDMENFEARNRWLCKLLCIFMANDYIDQVRKDASSRKTHKCKGVPYVKFDCKNVFVADIEKKLVEPLSKLVPAIARAKTPQQLYDAVSSFHRAMYGGSNQYKQCKYWVDAFKGMGAYATMQNLLRFHGCTYPKTADCYNRRKTDLQMLEDAANKYANEGWRLFGIMRETIEQNGIDIERKMKEWKAAKDAKNLRR